MMQDLFSVQREASCADSSDVTSANPAGNFSTKAMPPARSEWVDTSAKSAVAAYLGRLADRFDA